MTNQTNAHAQASSKEFIVLMASLMSIIAISIDALLPALGNISSDFAISNRNHAQYVVSFIFMGMALGEIICGPLSDALGRKKILYVGIAIYFVGSVICYMAQDFEMLLVGRVIQGIGVSGPYVSAVSIVRDRYSGAEMARIMSVVMMIFILVPAIAPSLGQAILFFGDWRDVFILYILYSAGIGIWLALRLEETLPPERRIPFRVIDIAHGFREVISNRVTMGYMLCMGTVFGSFIGYLNSSQQIFQEQFGVGKMFTVYFGVLALVLGAASLANAKFVGKFGMRPICIWSMVAIVVSSLVFAALHLVVEIQLWMFLTYAAVLFFNFGLVFGNINAIAMEPMGHVAGTASAVIGAVSSIISLFLGSLIGQLYDNTLVPVALGFLILGAITIGLMRYADGGKQPA